MLVSNGNENFISPVADSALWNHSTIFLDGFIERTLAYSLEEDITSQEGTVKASQKKLSTLQDGEKDLADKIKKHENDLTDNRDKQNDQKRDIENQVLILENLKLKRKG